MKCNTWFISSVCYHLSILVLHFKFLSYHYFNCFCFHILVTFTFFLFTFSRVIIVSYCTLFFNFQIVTSLYVRPWRKEAVPSEILVKNIIYIPDCKISQITSIRVQNWFSVLTCGRFTWEHWYILEIRSPRFLTSPYLKYNK